MQLGSTWYGVAANGSCFELGERTGNRVTGVIRRIARFGTLHYSDGRKERTWVRVFEKDTPPLPPPTAHTLTAHAVAGPPCGPVSGAACPASTVESLTEWGFLDTTSTSAERSISIDVINDAKVIVSAQASIGVIAGFGVNADFTVFVDADESEAVVVTDTSGGTKNIRWAFTVPAGTGISVGARVTKTSGTGTATWADLHLIVEIFNL
jgi:hypothetical protein